MRMKENDWDDVFNTNLKGAFLLTKAVSRQMMKQRTVILLIFLLLSVLAAMRDKQIMSLQKQELLV